MKKRGRRDERETVQAPLSKPEFWARLETFLDRNARWLAIALVVVATARIVSTYWTFSYTVDEPAHIAAGMEWIEKHVYKYEAQHPPLTRVMAALLPKLAGAHGHNRNSMGLEGIDVLSDGGRMNDDMLALSRAGILPFFWIACWLTFLLARWISESDAAAVIAVFLVTMTPALLAHGGLATTDMGLTAMLLFAVYAACRWLESPGWREALTFGAAVGLAAISKHSTLAFLPAIAAVAPLLWFAVVRPLLGSSMRALGPAIVKRIPQLAAAGIVTALVIWAAFFFSIGTSKMFSYRVPAPEFFDGIDQVRTHNRLGHLTYMLGKTNTVGWKSFYAVALGVKTPMPILLLGCGGLILLLSRKLYGARGLVMPSIVIGVVGFSTFYSQIMIGIRHILPVFVAFGIAGGCAVVWILRQHASWTKYAAGVVCLWTLATSIAAHPDYLAYFNYLAGDRPEEYFVDSDLDWAQDVKRVAERLNAAGAREVYFHQYAAGDLERLFGFPKIKELDYRGPQPGWNAVSITSMKYGLFGDARYVGDPGFKFWPETTPGVERIGKGMLLYYRPPSGP